MRALGSTLAAMFAIALASSTTAAGAPGPAVGRAAPDFAYVAAPYGWRHLHDARAEGAVLLLFEPAEEVLASLRRAEPDLARRGLTPIVIRWCGQDENWRAIERHGLRCSLLSDPHGALFAEFGLSDRGRPASGWCVVDAAGIVRSAGTGAGALDATLGPLAGDR